MSFGENVRSCRERQGLKQESLAREVGVTQAMLCQVEKGIRTPSVAVAGEIARALGCTVDELLRPNEQKENPA